jgi:hypothetical protein
MSQKKLKIGVAFVSVSAWLGGCGGAVDDVSRDDEGSLGGSGGYVPGLGGSFVGAIPSGGAYNVGGSWFGVPPDIGGTTGGSITDGGALGTGGHQPGTGGLPGWGGGFVVGVPPLAGSGPEFGGSSGE